MTKTQIFLTSLLLFPHLTHQQITLPTINLDNVKNQETSFDVDAAGRVGQQQSSSTQENGNKKKRKLTEKELKELEIMREKRRLEEQQHFMRRMEKDSEERGEEGNWIDT